MTEFSVDSGDLATVWALLYPCESEWERAVRDEYRESPLIGVNGVLAALTRVANAVANKQTVIRSLIDQQAAPPAKKIVYQSILASIIDKTRLRDAILRRHLALHNKETEVDPLLQREERYCSLALTVSLNRSTTRVGQDQTIRSRILARIYSPGEHGNNQSPGTAAADDEGRPYVWRGGVAYMHGDQVEEAERFKKDGPLVNSILVCKDDDHLLAKALITRKSVVSPTEPRQRRSQLGVHLKTLGYTSPEALIAAGRVAVDGRAAENVQVPINSRSTIVVDGELVSSPPTVPGTLAVEDFDWGVAPQDLEPAIDARRFQNFSERLFGKGERLCPEELKTLSDEASERLGSGLDIKGLTAMTERVRTRFVVMWLIESAKTRDLCSLLKRPGESEDSVQVKNRVSSTKRHARSHLLCRVLRPDFKLGPECVRAGLAQAIADPDDDDRSCWDSLKEAIGFVGFETILLELLGVVK